MDILSAAEFAAQGTTPGVILSIARFNHNFALLHDSPDNMVLAMRLRELAHEVGQITGASLPKRTKAGANDNPQSRKAQRRRAA